jgi:hypothetical protein
MLRLEHVEGESIDPEPLGRKVRLERLRFE